jgi:hypothetical protein
MSDVIELFKREFMSYVLSLDLLEGSSVFFGNMDYDFDLFVKDGEYILDVFSVALDHYGMPYRNSLDSERFNVSNLFEV